MQIDISDIAASFRNAHEGKYSRHEVPDRLEPSLLQYDYLTLSALAADVKQLLLEVPIPLENGPAIALDIGCGKSPYRELLESRGFIVKTLDINDANSPDYTGTIEDTGLPDGSVDLIICTQVLEHSLDPREGLQEISRILRSKGHLIASAPHVWFYHPHPTDNWRFTQEGLTRLVATAGLEARSLLSQGGSVMALFQIVNFLLFGVLGKLGSVLYLINNVVGKLGDRLFANPLFCLNFAILARKP